MTEQRTSSVWKPVLQVIIGVVASVLAWWLIDDIGTALRINFELSMLEFVWLGATGLVFTLVVLWSFYSAVAAAVTLIVGVLVGLYMPRWVPTQEVNVVPIDAIDLRLIVLRGAHDPAVMVLIGATLAVAVRRARCQARSRTE